ncbi:hypothetical protein HDU96_002520 [Phlyctochytrium bullatum]|nr:hypothetical protein HDU96_002520 [Phlyctochytrium bullatum]
MSPRRGILEVKSAGRGRPVRIASVYSEHGCNGDELLTPTQAPSNPFASRAAQTGGDNEGHLRSGEGQTEPDVVEASASSDPGQVPTDSASKENVESAHETMGNGRSLNEVKEDEEDGEAVEDDMEIEDVEMTYSDEDL